MGAGRQVTDAQVKELRVSLHQGASLYKAAMKGGMDRKTGAKYRDLGQLPSEARTPHTWRTRPDPLVEVWPTLTEMLQREPTLQAKTLLEWLQRQYADQNWQPQRRTLERRVRQWKAEHGPAKEVFFSQVHEPGRLGSSDFTHMSSLAVTIQGQPFAHMLYHFVLTYSNWEHVTVCFSESFASLSAGWRSMVWELGGVPESTSFWSGWAKAAWERVMSAYKSAARYASQPTLPAGRPQQPFPGAMPGAGGTPGMPALYGTGSMNNSLIDRAARNHPPTRAAQIAATYSGTGSGQYRWHSTGTRQGSANADFRANSTGSICKCLVAAHGQVRRGTPAHLPELWAVRASASTLWYRRCEPAGRVSPRARRSPS